MSAEDELLIAFELHSIKNLRSLLKGGFDVRRPIRGKLPIDWLTEMYSRSDAFPECLSLMLEHGAVLADPVLAPVLLNDAAEIRGRIAADSAVLDHRTTMVSPFTPLVGASLLHVAAEYGNLDAARVLIEMGADVDVRADVDEVGLNGHTPLFHTVNSSSNRSAPIMHALLDAGASAELKLAGITWGKGFEWETTFFDVTPISYAQCGLLPQVHRGEEDIYGNIRVLMETCGRKVPPLDNVPNRYLKAAT